MKLIKKIGCLLLAVIMIAGSFSGIGASAGKKVAQPVIKLKKINDGTGVKIVISKTKGAEGYYVYMTKRKDAYKKYILNKGEDQVEIGIIKKSGKKEREFVINGLPEGKYTFAVEAYMLDSNGFPELNKSRFSKQKTVKIKAVSENTEAPVDTDTQAKKYDYSLAKTGDIIEFGSYEQNDLMTDGREAIEWIVLERTEDRLLAVSRYALNVLPYNKKYGDTGWEKSSIRKWLNGYFYDTAFSEYEKDMIAATELENPANKFYDLTDAGNNTVDNVFLLSMDDLVNEAYGFGTSAIEKEPILDKDDEDYREPQNDPSQEKYKLYDEDNIYRRCAATPYAKALGLMTADINDDPDWNHNRWSKYATSDDEPACIWWLRTPGNSDSNAVDVMYDGSVSIGGRVKNLNAGVRPAVYIRLR